LLTTLESLVAGTALHVPPTDEDARKAHAFERGDVRPTNLAPVILPDGNLGWMPWGLSVTWQNQPVINARAETLDEKPTFRPLLQQRCLVPATAYFEWRTEGKLKFKNRITASNTDVFTFAGLFSDGKFTIVTCAPTPSIAHIHDRMPVILEGNARKYWLDTNQTFAVVKNLLCPFTGGLNADEATPPLARQGAFAF